MCACMHVTAGDGELRGGAGRQGAPGEGMHAQGYIVLVKENMVQQVTEHISWLQAHTPQCTAAYTGTM